MDVRMKKSLGRGRSAFLASVTSAKEARFAVANGADLIDCKDPASGALGALPVEIVRTIVNEVGGRVPVSATIGDLPADAVKVVEATATMASCGVDYVKIGFFGDGDPYPTLQALSAAVIKPARLIAVLMADRAPDIDLLPALAEAGFAGVMLDTAGKASGRLRDHLDDAQLASFVARAHALGLVAGLAGSLKLEDIAALVPLDPDVLGFRGALCSNGRVSSLDEGRVFEVRRALDAAHALRETAERSVA